MIQFQCIPIIGVRFYSNVFNNPLYLSGAPTQLYGLPLTFIRLLTVTIAELLLYFNREIYSLCFTKLNEHLSGLCYNFTSLVRKMFKRFQTKITFKKYK